MFSVGDLVVHPMHGAGVIDDIVRERVAGSTQEYYVFKMPVGGLLLKIPIAKPAHRPARHHRTGGGGAAHQLHPGNRCGSGQQLE